MILNEFLFHFDRLKYCNRKKLEQSNISDDGEFDVSDTGSDDESTIAKEERAMKDEDVTNEIKSLEKEADQDFDDLFASVGIFIT